MKSRALRFGIPAALSCLLWGAVTRAQSNDTMVAEALFQEGRALLEAGKSAEACPKLAESLRLDPATGTLMALAICHEKEGKLASSWSEYAEAERRSRREGRADREALARERIAALKPRLSVLTIEVPPAVAAIQGLEIRRDGAVLGRGAWNAAVPIDGGEHAVQALAPGKQPWEGKIAVQNEGDQARLAVPELAPAPDAPPPPAATAPSAAVSPVAPTQPADRWGTLEWVGIGVGGAGVIGLGVGGYFLASALGKLDDSKADCDGDACGERGLADRQDAVDNGNLATVFAIGGGVLAATGATLFVLARTSDTETPSASVGVMTTPGGLGATLGGAF